eukprot:5466898-Prorocentrum_lima.AAC.1
MVAATFSMFCNTTRRLCSALSLKYNDSAPAARSLKYNDSAPAARSPSKRMSAYADASPVGRPGA